MRFLCGDADRAVIGVTCPHGNAADRLHGGVGHRDSICAERQCLDEIGGFPQTARDNERNVAPAGCIEVTPCPGQRRDRWYRDVVPEDNGSGAGTAATAVEDDVIDADIKCSIDVFFYVLCR